MKTFTDFKIDFYDKVKDLSLFNCRNINLLKVVLDGLKVDYVAKNINTEDVFSRKFPIKNYLNRLRHQKKIKAAKSQIHKHAFSSEYIFFEVSRSVNDGGKKSTYFHHILSELKNKQPLVVLEKSDCDFLQHNITKQDLYFAYFFNQSTIDELDFKKKLEQSLSAIKSSNLFSVSDMENIKRAFCKFYIEYLVWSRFLKEYTFNKHVFVCHYHKEGQILAFKNQGIKCIELQHGLISEKDIFYCFPEPVKSIKNIALFADEIIVYGNYWKKVLLKGAEYKDEQIKILGNYTYHQFISYSEIEKQLKERLAGKTVLLVSTQTFLHEHYINYIKFLLKSNQENNISQFHIIIKPHPSEKIELYKNAFLNIADVSVLTYPIEVLLKLVDIHLSIYSTTLYTASGYNVINYTLRIKSCEDYVQDVLNSGVAYEIFPNENLFLNVDKYRAHSIDSEEYFCEYKGLNNVI